MEFTYRIKEAKKEYVQAENTDKIHVIIEVLKGEEVVEERAFGYPLDATKDTITTELNTFIETYNADHQRNIENAEQEAKQAQADVTIAALLGNEPKAPESTEGQSAEATGEGESQA